jgi:CheY-like chemotaxis protein
VVILLAEDDLTIRFMFSEALSEAGYTVLEASDGAEALHVSRAFPDVIHLLLTDLKMPQMAGLELATRLQQERPSTKVVIMTGNEGGIPISWLPHVIEKPVLSAEVLARIERELGALCD